MWVVALKCVAVGEAGLGCVVTAGAATWTTPATSVHGALQGPVRSAVGRVAAVLVAVLLPKKQVKRKS